MSPYNDEDVVNSNVKKCIAKLLNELSITCTSLNISSGAKPGDNYLGIITKVKVTGKSKTRDDTVINLIVKSAPHQDAYRAAIPVRVAYEREFYMYSQVLPEFNKLQQEKKVLKPFKAFAKYYASTMGDSSETIVMEDMKELGYKLCDRHEPLDYHHAQLVMKEYGKLHAFSFALRDQNAELFEKLSNNTRDTFFKNMKKSEGLLKTLKEWSDKALDALDPVNEKTAYDKLKNFAESMFDVAQEKVRAEPAGAYAVIGHGDNWINNILFKYGDSTNPHKPTDLCLLDWQLSRLGSPALDLAYFIYTCTDKDLRDKHYDRLIRNYYESFSSFLLELGSNPKQLFPFEVLQEHLKKFCAYGLYMAIILIYLMSSDTEEIPDFHNGTDEDDVMERYNFPIKNMEQYSKRIRGVIVDFVKYNYDF